MNRFLRSRSLPARTSSTSRVRVAAGGVAVAALLLAGCSDDADVATDDTPTTAADASFTAFCDGVVAADAATMAAFTPEGEPDPELVAAAKDAIRAVGEEAPDEIATDVQELVEGGLAQYDSPEGETPEGFDAVNLKVHEWVGDNCGYDSVDTVAKDYSYEGMPTELSAGTYSINLTNEGEELHEMAFMRVNDGVTTSVDDILNLPEDQALEMVTPVGMVVAMPGEKGSATAELTSGRYIVVCFIPVGLTPEAMAAPPTDGPPEFGPPHFTQGMVHEITID